MSRRSKSRLKMFGMIFCCSSVIAAMATSTMAWYSAQSSIDVESSTVTIRTPFQYYLYAYKGNRFPTGTWSETTYSSSKGTGYATANANYALSVTDANVLNSYEEVNDIKYSDSDQEAAYKAALTQVSGLWPGYKMSFAIKAEGLDATADNPVLKITKYRPGSSSTKVISTANTPGGGKHVCLAEAIRIVSGTGTSLAAAVTAAGSASNILSYPYASDISNNSEVSADLSLGAEAGSNTTYWWFYTIEFTNDSGTWYYKTGTASGTTETTGASNYYYRSTSGNSSVYEGLTFAITTMSLENPS